MKNRKSILAFAIMILLFSCNKSFEYDLAISNVDVFNSEQGEVLANKTILIHADSIVSVIPAGQKVNAKKEINGMGRLVTPGFIDTHIHLTDLYGDYELAPEFIPEDSLKSYRDKLSQTYLRHGVTTVKVAGQPEKWIRPTLNWQQTPMPHYPDIFISGGALISAEERAPYINHVEVESPEDAQDKIQAYHDLGIRHLKLYWRLGEPELRAAIHKAKELNMNLTAHIDQNIVSIWNTLNYGLRHYEHVHTLSMSVFRFNAHFEDFMKDFNEEFRDLTSDRFFALMMEIFRYVHQHPELANELDQLIHQMADHEATLSTTIHLFAEKGGLTYFSTEPVSSEDVTPTFTRKQTDRYREDFKIMMTHVKKAHDLGVSLVLGTDSPEGGKAALSEMLLLSEEGFPIEDILQIATINGAKAMNLDHLYGAIEKGKKANLVIFEENPFDNYRNFLSEKIIIKDGMIYSPEIE